MEAERLFNIKWVAANEVSRAMRAVSGGKHSPNSQMIEEKKRTTSKTRTAAAGHTLEAIPQIDRIVIGSSKGTISLQSIDFEG